MLFSELLLQARQRLYDIRESNGQLITDASKDGIRWSSVDLQSACKGATLELLRTLMVLKAKSNFSITSAFQLASNLTIKAGSGILSGTLPAGTTHVIKIQTTDLSQIYSPITQDEYFSNRYSAVDTNGTNAVGDNVFAEFYDAASKSIQILTLPLPTSDISNVQAYVRVPFITMLDINSAEEIPLYDVDDLLLDYCEREARRREHNVNQVKDLNESIMEKLRGLASGLQDS